MFPGCPDRFHASFEGGFGYEGSKSCVVIVFTELSSFSNFLPRQECSEKIVKEGDLLPKGIDCIRRRTWWQMVKTCLVTGVGEAVEKKGFCYIVAPLEDCWKVLKQIKMELLYDPATTIWGVKQWTPKY